MGKISESELARRLGPWCSPDRLRKRRKFLPVAKGEQGKSFEFDERAVFYVLLAENMTTHKASFVDLQDQISAIDYDRVGVDQHRLVRTVRYIKGHPHLKAAKWESDPVDGDPSGSMCLSRTVLELENIKEAAIDLLK